MYLCVSVYVYITACRLHLQLPVIPWLYSAILANYYLLMWQNCIPLQFLIIFQAVGGFLLVVTSSGKVVYITEAVEQFFGHSQVW